MAVLKNINGPELERIKKKSQSLFRKYGLEIIIECNKKVIDYLNIILNLNNGTYKPYYKPDKVFYKNVQLSHPPSMTVQ